jgi:hypothetical protein
LASIAFGLRFLLVELGCSDLRQHIAELVVMGDIELFLSI